MWKRAMTYLGLGDDDDYAEYDYDEPAPEPRRPVQQERRPAAPREPMVRPPAQPDEQPEVTVRGGTVRPMPAQPRQPESGVGAVTARRAPGGTATRPVRSGGGGAVVRPLPIPVTAKPHVVIPRSFNEAQEVADLIKSNAPVIMNLQEADRDLSRRLIDFASGLCYGLGGSMERVANSVYLLTPTDVEVSAEDKRRLEERGYSH